jgi:hypothetical protein
MSDQGGGNVPQSAQVPAPVPARPDVPMEGRKRKWVLRAIGAGAVLAVVAAWVGVNASALRARLAVRQLAAAATDEDRARWADELIGYGEPGLHRLTECLTSGTDPVRAAAAAALDRHLTALPDGDTRAVTISGLILDVFPGSGAGGKRAVLDLTPTILNRTGTAHAQRCRAIVAESLAAADLDVRLAAARAAIHPELRLRAELVPLLGAPEPELRRAALFGVATAEDQALLGDEDLFRFLHDPDEGVRKVCRAVLVGRDRSDPEIALGRRLTDPDPTERLKLLIDLRYDDEVPDPEPWLERLSRDPEPAVRAGAARVAVELAAARASACPGWVARVADADPHPTVRFVAAHYRARPMPVGPVRPAGLR